ncbi:MAG: hypothetical protein ACRC1J_09370 [Sandaracinobacteroides sp.]
MTTGPVSNKPPTLDEALQAWASTEPAGAGDPAALARILHHADAVAVPARKVPAFSGRRPLWLAGGAVAASVAVALLFAPDPVAGPGASPSAADRSPVILAEASPDTTAAFELLYTPTAEEEFLL